MKENNQLLEEKKKKIVGFMKEEAYKPLLFSELVTVLDVPKDQTEVFQEVLDQLEEEGKVFRTRKERYAIPERMNLVTGILQGHERGFGFVLPDEETMEDVFIPADSLNGAMNRDKVIARINRKVGEGKKTEGEIIKILSRANSRVVGSFESSRYFGFVVPDDKRIPGDIFIPKDEIGDAKTGQKVVVEILIWPEKRRNAEGRIVEILGDKEDPGTDILSIIRSYNLEEEFPEEVVEQAEDIPDTVSREMIGKRRDLRKLRMVTIDGEDAKDLDDAVSLEVLDNGLYRLGVHIADVAEYVTDDSPLDREALKRGTSVYLVDRVIPMLPRKLSNGICSLNPRVDRLAMTVMMDIDDNGKVISHEVFESVINIDERMTYKNVTKILVDEDPELMEKYDYLIDDFRLMEELALILRKKRMDRGAIDFDFDEAKIILDEKGKPVDVKRYEITISNKIIEEFMLVCNETVAEHFFWTNTPFLYRVHEDPDQEKIEAFNEFLFNFGLSIKGVNKIHPRALQAVLEKVKGQKEERIISTIMLRSLKKARYSDENMGHFGLAAKYYSHFTSPIRRYPDLMIHRIIKESIRNRITPSREERLKQIMPEIAKLTSERERKAEEAERETEDLKKTEFMKDREGEVFTGTISGVTSFGMFIQLENTVEGLVRLSNMEDDFYIFNEKQYCLVGERRKKIYRIGDTVKVKLMRADLSSRQIDFMLQEEGSEEITERKASWGSRNYKDNRGGKDKKGKKEGKKEGVFGKVTKDKKEINFYKRGAFKKEGPNPDKKEDAPLEIKDKSAENEMASEKDEGKNKPNRRTRRTKRPNKETIKIGSK